MVKEIIVSVFSTNCFLFSEDNKNCVIIDPGGNNEQIISTIDDSGLQPIGIALTHGHLDHTSAIGKLLEYYKEKGIILKIAIHENDSTYLGAPALARHERGFRVFGIVNLEEYFPGLSVPLPEADILLKEGDSIFNTCLKVIETPGHSKGGVCFFCEKENILFSGDALFFQGIGRTDLEDGDSARLVESIKNKLLVLPSETIVYPGHGPETTIDREQKNNLFLK